jgi:hypothetical protein
LIPSFEFSLPCSIFSLEMDVVERTISTQGQAAAAAAAEAAAAATTFFSLVFQFSSQSL